MIEQAEAPAGEAPVVHPDAAAFWEALADGDFRLQRCLECETVRFPVAPVCWNCLSPDHELTGVDPSGTVTTSVVVERVTSGSVWAEHVPYRTGLVSLAGAGLRVPGRILCDCGEAARPGTPVTMCRLPALDGPPVWAFRHSCHDVRSDAAQGQEGTVQPQQVSKDMPAFDELGGLRLRRRDGTSSRRPAVYSPKQLEAIRRAEAYAAEPLRGIVTGDGPVAGLFPLTDHGIDTSPLAAAARDFLAALTPQEQAECRFPMDHPSWRHWANPAKFYLRHGLCLGEFDQGKRDAAFEVIRRSLSDYGLTLVRDIMRLNRTIGELRGEENELNEWLYWFSIYGQPQDGEPWGWQLDGHHANVNCAVVGSQMVITPTFLGAEPVFAWSGAYAGTRVFRQEEAKAAELFGLLGPDQRQVATLGGMLPEDLFLGAFRDNFEMNYQGIRYGDLSAGQQAVALDLLGLYVGRAGGRQAALTMGRVLEHAAALHFAWIRASDRDDVFYYRIHSPVILVEFEHVPGVMFDNDYPTPNHIHTVVRTPNGNDYGADLLRQHHERHHRVRPPFQWTPPASNAG